MSRGAGSVESRIADLFAVTRDRALSIEEIAAHAFGLTDARPSRAQRLSATRAAHRLLRRVRQIKERASDLIAQAHANTKAALGDEEHQARLDKDADFIEGMKLHKKADRIGTWTRFYRADRRGWILRAEDDFWCETTVKGRLWFHPPDVPVVAWAVSIQPAGVIWAEAELVKITHRNVMVRYAGTVARLSRKKLWYGWAFWRGVRFVSSRSGRIADKLDRQWQARYGGAGSVPPLMRMPLARAMQLLDVPTDYTGDDVIIGFRRAAKKSHPDMGGTAEMFRLLVEARDRLLAALGTSEPAPTMPAYGPSGSRYVYRRASSRQSRLGFTARLSVIE